MACKAMRNVRHEHLVVHHGKDSQEPGLKCLSALSFMARNFGHAKLIDVNLLHKSDLPGFEKHLMRALKVAAAG